MDLLEERKFAKTFEEVERLALRYGVDVESLERVARFVTSPSVRGGGGGEAVAGDSGPVPSLKVCVPLIYENVFSLLPFWFVLLRMSC